MRKITMVPENVRYDIALKTKKEETFKALMKDFHWQTWGCLASNLRIPSSNLDCLMEKVKSQLCYYTNNGDDSDYTVCTIMELEHVEKNLAKNHNISYDTAKELSSSENVDIRGNLAQNKIVMMKYPDIQEILSNDESYGVRCEIAEITNIPEIMDKMLKDASDMVVHQLARNELIDTLTQKKLLTYNNDKFPESKNESIRYLNMSSLLANPRTSQEVLDECSNIIMNNQTDKNYYHKEVCLASHPNTSIDTLEKLLKSTSNKDAIKFAKRNLRYKRKMAKKFKRISNGWYRNFFKKALR